MARRGHAACHFRHVRQTSRRPHCQVRASQDHPPFHRVVTRSWMRKFLSFAMLLLSDAAASAAKPIHSLVIAGTPHVEPRRPISPILGSRMCFRHVADVSSRCWSIVWPPLNRPMSQLSGSRRIGANLTDALLTAEPGRCEGRYSDWVSRVSFSIRQRTPCSAK